MPASVHLLDDEAAILQLLSTVCKNLGLQVFKDQDPLEALVKIEQNQPDLLIVDLKLGTMSGLEVIQKVRELSPNTRIIMITGYSSVDTAVEAMRLGAYDYITKPFKLEEFKLTIKQALKITNSAPSKTQATSPQIAPEESERFLAESASMRKILGTIRKIAPLNTRLLLTGEAGVGKGHIAKYLHDHSPRKQAPFKTLYISAFSPDSLELELFGSENSIDSTIFARSKGGTVHLAEIHRMPMRVQSRLLAFLNQNGLEQHHVQLVCSSQTSLDCLIDKGEFRQDLFYKISIVPIHIPSLNERSEDIRIFAHHFLEQCCSNSKSGRYHFEPYSLELLERYPWPGNISELANVVEHAFAMAEDNCIKAEHLPSKLHRASTTNPHGEPPSKSSTRSAIPLGLKLHEFVEQQQKWYIEETLKYFQGSREKAATSLGISVATLYRKLDLKAKSRTTL